MDDIHAQLHPSAGSASSSGGGGGSSKKAKKKKAKAGAVQAGVLTGEEVAAATLRLLTSVARFHRRVIYTLYIFNCRRFFVFLPGFGRSFWAERTHPEVLNMAWHGKSCGTSIVNLRDRQFDFGRRFVRTRWFTKMSSLLVERMPRLGRPGGSFLVMKGGKSWSSVP